MLTVNQFFFNFLNFWEYNPKTVYTADNFEKLSEERML